MAGSVDQVPAAVRKAVEELRRRLEASFGADLLEVRLFGSAARGQMTESSDVDVLVVLRQAGWAERGRVLDIAGHLWRESDLFISPTVLDGPTAEKWRRQERALIVDADREGVAF